MTFAVFHDYPGLEYGLPNLRDFPGPVVTMLNLLTRSYMKIMTTPYGVDFGGNTVHIFDNNKEDNITCFKLTEKMEKKTTEFTKKNTEHIVDEGPLHQLNMLLLHGRARVTTGTQI